MEKYTYSKFKVVPVTKNGNNSWKVIGFGSQTLIEEREDGTWVIDPVKKHEIKVNVSKQTLEESLENFPHSCFLDGIHSYIKGKRL